MKKRVDAILKKNVEKQKKDVEHKPEVALKESIHEVE